MSREGADAVNPTGQGEARGAPAKRRAERVVVAMSGGVDSSLAAALVVERGFEAIGITMHLAGGASRCCSLADADDARRVAEKLGMRFYVANYRERFRREVQEAFADAYLAGRTPIPCVTCNSRFKFDYLRERAEVLGARRVATGHYARIDLDPESGRYRLRRAVDRSKDQSYFLFELNQRQLASTWFPLGEMTKTSVRERARTLGLQTAEKPESQELCFVPDGDYAALVERLRPEAAQRTGDFVDESGRVLGRHRGVHHYTVGQRRGLGISAAKPLYVRAIDSQSRRVVLGEARELHARGADLEAVSWLAGTPPQGPLRAEVQVRHRHRPVPASVEARGERRARVHFDEPVRAIAPGQAAVFYRADEVLGGGWIARSLR